jgi:predicted dinucleotide-binding enzyme
VKIGIIGPGKMGFGLARLWAAEGNQIMLSYSRTEDKLKALAEELGPDASWGSAEDAARFGDVVVLATPWWATQQAMVATNGALEDKIIIDVTNPLKEDFSGLDVGTSDSGGEVVQRTSGGRVIKAFNAIFGRALAEGGRDYGHHKPALFYAGDDADAKEIVAGLIEQTGYRPVDAGPLRSARYLEPLVMLNVELGRTHKLKPQWAITLVEK